MNKATRLQYLEAMGIDVWVPRDRQIDDRAVLAANENTPAHLQVASQAEFGRIAPVEKWQALTQKVAACQQCALCQTRTQTVFGSGDQQAQWMLVGEAPGQNEDLEGLPFVGRAGQLLTEMIRALGLARDAVYITNILKCRPPNNRDPQAQEVAACAHFLKQQIAMVQPKLILAVGRVAAQNLLQTKAPLSQLRGKVHYLDKIPVIVIYHPAYLLRSLLEKRKAWQDLQNALNFYRNGKN